ncbi:hypothetical protein R3P38DRAFT_2873402 [Favolaschia claudopus]|uniref:F-box domain-containing protein n=1 Tax=Favolaschia claudopus TaxID=2862362 RepID=A0AAW0D4B8_9AGAR
MLRRLPAFQRLFLTFMSLKTLAPELVLEILFHLDVYTVISISSVNKDFRCIAFTNQLWLSLLDELDFHNLVDLPPRDLLRSCSTTDLMAIVKRTICGPASWLPASSSVVEPQRKLTFKLSPHIVNNLINIYLIRGGKYALVQTVTSMNIHEVQSGKQISLFDGDYMSTNWALDLQPGGKTLRLLRVPGRNFGSSEIVLWEVDLSSGRALEIFRLNFPGVEFRRMCTIHGDFLTFGFSSDGSAHMPVMLVNWREETYISLNYVGRTYYGTHVALIPDHIVASYIDNFEPFQRHLAITSFSSLENKCQPLHTFDLNIGSINEIWGHDIPFDFHEELIIDSTRPLRDLNSYIRLHAFPSIVHGGAYKLRIYVCISPPSPAGQSFGGRFLNRMGIVRSAQGTAALLSYLVHPRSSSSRLSYPSPITIQLTSTLAAVPAPSTPACMSYARYCLDDSEWTARIDRYAGRSIVDVLCARSIYRNGDNFWSRRNSNRNKPRVVLTRITKPNWLCLRLSLNGAVVHVEGDLVVIEYYA